MKKKVFLLNSCSTCQRIVNELNLTEHGFEFQNIKEENIDEATLDQIAQQEGGYEQVFSKRAMKYRGMGLHEQDLSEADFKKHILSEYTFVKRPVIQLGDTYFVGNSKKVVEAAKKAINEVSA